MSVATSGMEGTRKNVAHAPIKNAVLIAGPTASGKSALALRVARELGGVIVNTDSMQVYDVLDLITARPSPADLECAPHRLYGHVDPSVSYSTGAWLKDVADLLADLDGATPIFVGGTGLYFRALTQGLSPMPDVPADIREAWRARAASEGAAALHAELAHRDPQAAARIRPSDAQRLVRALEVLEASGRSILSWQAEKGRSLVGEETARRIVLDPDAEELAVRIVARVDRMVEGGGVSEVERLLSLNLSPALPAMKAIGVRELGAVVRDEIDLATAKVQMAAATRQYAKRQRTWFRTQLGDRWKRLATPIDCG